MHDKAYIRVVSDEATVRALHKQTNVPGASIAPLKARREDNGEVWWNWQTPHVEIHDGDVDCGVKALLERYRSLFARIKKDRGPGADIYLEVVTYYEQNNPSPPRLYLSAESIVLLGELGAALDHDVVPAVFPHRSEP